MRLSTVATLTVLSLQFFSLDEAGGQAVGGKLAAEKHPTMSARGRKTRASSHEGDGGRGTRRQPSGGSRKVEERGEARDGRALNQPRPGGNMVAAGSRKQTPQLPAPPKRKGQVLQNHLKGHGEFNTDTHSCFGIQSKNCKKPADCDGCLGLYTCKLPRGKCDLKAVSRNTGSFSQSIQNR